MVDRASAARKEEKQKWRRFADVSPARGETRDISGILSGQWTVVTTEIRAASNGW